MVQASTRFKLRKLDFNVSHENHKTNLWMINAATTDTTPQQKPKTSENTERHINYALSEHKNINRNNINYK